MSDRKARAVGGWFQALAAPSGLRWGAGWSIGIAIAIASLLVVSGGQPIPLVVVGVLAVVWTLHDPLVAVPPMIVCQVIWLVGGYAPGDIAALSPGKLSIGIVLVGWVVWAWRNRVAPTYAPHQWGLGAFFIIILLGPVLTPAFDDSLIGIGKYGLMFLPYLLVANVAVDRRGVTVVVAAITLAACVSACLALVERLMPGIALEFDGVSLGAHTDDISLGGISIKRVTGGIGDANWFSYTMATTLPLCLYWYRAYSGGWIRLCAVVAALLQTVGLVLSYTRTPMIGLAGALAFLLWQRRLPLMPVIFAGIVGLVSAPVWLPEGFVDRFFSSEYIAEGSTPLRKEIFEMAVELIEDRPILGFGYQQFGPEFIKRSTSDVGWEWNRRDEDGEEPAYLLRAHNLYLDVWVQHGIIGLAALMAAFGMLLRELWVVSRVARPREADLAVCVFASLLSFYLCGLGGHSQELKILWVIAGLAAGLRRWVLSGYRSPVNSA